MNRMSVLLSRRKPRGVNSKRFKTEWKQKLIPFDGDLTNKDDVERFRQEVLRTHPGWTINATVPVPGRVP